MIKLLKQKLIELSGRFPLLTIRIKLDPFIPSPEITEKKCLLHMSCLDNMSVKLCRYNTNSGA